ncbi:site-specific integrase [Streptomyces sp. NPDC006459]|uniref:site-specific integrase n=1 Tax=Streptomyces sp. NPDC006459 TaxID=3154303 RepID=UPI0033AA8312
MAEEIPRRCKGLVLLGASTGLRPGELFGLQLQHVDLLHATVSVEQQIQQTAKHGVYVCPPKTARSHRTVPLPRMAVDAMKAHLGDFPADGPESWIFTAPQGGPVVYTHFMDGSWRPACAKAGIEKGTGPHSLRHHYASLLIKHGESVKTVSERLGHTNAAMTLNIYTHPWPDSEERTRAARQGVRGPVRRCPDTGRRSGVAASPRADRSRRAADSVRTAKAAQPAPSQVRRPFVGRIRR